MTDAALIPDLIRAGVAPELVARVVELQLAVARAEGVSIEVIAKAERSRASRKERNARYYKTHSDVLRRSKTSYKERSPEPPKRNITPLGSSPSALNRHPPAGGDDRARQGTRLPADWHPSDALAAFAAGVGVVGHRLDQAVAEFRDYWTAVPGQRGRKLDWDATFRNRLRDKNAQQQRGPSNGGGKGSIVDAGRRQLQRIDEAIERQLRRADGDGPGDAPVRLLPLLGS